MNSLLPILKKELLETVRSKKLLILGIIFLFVAISSPILAKALPLILKSMPATPGLIIDLPDPTWRDAIDQFIKNISQIVMLVIVFMFAGSIAEEKNKKTLEIVLTKPISRTNFVLAKYFSSILLVKVIMIISAIIFYAYTASIFGNFSLINFAWLTLCVLIYLLVILSVTIFASTFASSQILAVAYAFMIQILILTLLPLIGKIKIYLPGNTIEHYKEIMASGMNHDLIPSLIISILLIFALIIASISIFKKQEIER